MQEENISNQISATEDFQDKSKINKLLNRARLILPFQVILLVISSYIFLPFFFSHDSESKFWGLLILGPYIILAIIAFAVFSTLGLINSIRLLKRRVINGFSMSVFFASIFCLIGFLIGVITFIIPIISSNIQYSNQQKEQKTTEQNRANFFHERYLALTEEFKQPQIAYQYINGQIIINVKENGEYIPGKTKVILLGYVNPIVYSDKNDQDLKNKETEKLWDDSYSIKGKTVSVILPGEALFTESYSCDGTSQHDCYLNYKNNPGTEYFFANVYLGDKLLNNNYTKEEQEIAQNGLGALSARSTLYWLYNSYTVRFKSMQKVLNYSFADKIYLNLENTNKVYPQGISVDGDVFSKPISVTLKGVTLPVPFSVIQQQKIEEFLKKNVIEHNIKITIPNWSEVQSLNQNFNDSDQKLSIQMDVQTYIEREKQSLNDQLQALVK